MDDQIALTRDCIDPVDAVGLFIVGDGEKTLLRSMEWKRTVF